VIAVVAVQEQIGQRYNLIQYWRLLAAACAGFTPMRTGIRETWGDDTIEEFLQRRSDYLYLACPVVAALSGVLFFAVWTAPSPTQRAIMMAAARMKANIAIRFMLFKRRFKRMVSSK
jgi:hypothetical protein